MEPPLVPDSVLGPRDVVVADGADARAYLHSQVAQDVTDLAAGESRWSFVLDPTGKIVSLARITCVDDEHFELDTDAGNGQALLDRLARFRIRVAVDLDLRPAEGGAPPTDERARVELGWPRVGAEIVPGETLVAGTGLSSVAVSFTKGCYPGQELVERMDSRGADAPRTLRRVAAPPDARPGMPIAVDGEEVGTYTTVAGDLALAWVKRGVDVGEAVAF